MDAYYHREKAKEADEVADAAESPDLRRHWNGIAQECRRLASSIEEQQHPDWRSIIHNM